LNLAKYIKSSQEEVQSAEQLFPEHTNQGISIVLGTIFKSEHFPSTPMSGKLGIHSTCKGAATYASFNGITKESVSKPGCWKGKEQMIDTYIDIYQLCFYLVT
jgi:hypothetical protein